MIYYVCKYTPIELFRGFGEECSVLEEMPENFEQSDQIAHANLCGFGKAVLEQVMSGRVKELVLVNCCDSMRRVYDIVESTGKCKFLYMLDLPHDDNECEKVKFAGTIRRLKKAYEAYSGKVFDKRAFIKSFITPEMNTEPYIGVLGVRVSGILEDMIRDNIQMDVENLTCTGGRKLSVVQDEMWNMEEEELFLSYADVLLGQMPCFRMNRSIRRNRLYLDPNLKGIIYHTIKFCDYYGFEYASIKRDIKVPLLKIETDFTSQSAGQLLTRIQAFEETIEGSEDMDPGKGISEEARKKMESGIFYVAGIDSGSTSTDVVILDQDGKIKSTMIIPTGGGAMMSAEKSLDLAIEKAGIKKEEIVRIDTTGYGRSYIDSGDDSITEITCHARGGREMAGDECAIIDVGGQDTKIILVSGGMVQDFQMNDKCSAGTGKFLEIMANRLGVTLQELFDMAGKGTVLPISSLCTVFAESEVINYIGEGQKREDIAAGVVDSVANKVAQLAMKKNLPDKVILTGGLSNSTYFTKILSQKLGQTVSPTEHGRYAGALGAALLAKEKKKR